MAAALPNHFINCFLVLGLAGATRNGGSPPRGWPGIVVFERWRVRERATQAMKVLSEVQFYWKAAV